MHQCWFKGILLFNHMYEVLVEKMAYIETLHYLSKISENLKLLYGSVLHKNTLICQ